MPYSKPKPPKNTKQYEAKKAANLAAMKASKNGTPLGAEKTGVESVTVGHIETVCHYMSENGEPLIVACRRAGTPSYNQMMHLIRNNSDIARQIDEARQLGAWTIACKTRSIARGGDGSTGDLDRDKLVIDTDFKVLRSMLPREFGDKKTIEHEGNVTQTIEMDIKEASRRLAFAINSGKLIDATINNDAIIIDQ